MANFISAKMFSMELVNDTVQKIDRFGGVGDYITDWNKSSERIK